MDWKKTVSYRSEAAMMAEHLFNELLQQEEEIHERLTAMGRNAFDQWLTDNTDEVIAYAVATLKKRETTKKWNKPETRLLLMYGAWLHCCNAHSLIDACDRLLMGFATTSREVIGEAGKIFRDVTTELPSNFWELED